MRFSALPLSNPSAESEVLIVSMVGHPLSASLLAKWFIAQVGTDPEQDLSNLKLQKLLYLAQSLFIHERGTPLAKEGFQAWEHGPVVSVLYKECKMYGDGPIRMGLVDDGPWTRLEDDVIDALERTWEGFGGYSALKLREITHQVGPWRNTYRPGVRNLVIPNESIGEAWAEFSKLTERRVRSGAEDELKSALGHFESLLQNLPIRHSMGNPTFLLEELDSLEGTRKHAAAQIL
ncbi:MAG: DUF4065 domain-containing protein [Cryobacterium sp.]|nr:DUF4065 domain-containing protein [Cryobacterium sp.]